MIAALSRSDADALVVVVKALASPARLQIVSLLLVAPARPYELEGLLSRQGTSLGQPTVSHHLAKLKAARLVRARKQGRFIVYDLTDAGREIVVRFLGKPGKR